MHDRYLQGLIAGMIGWLPQMAFTQTMYWGFHLVKFQYLDYGAVAGWSHRPDRIEEFIFAEFLVLGMQGFLGIAFAYWIAVVGSPNLLIKGGMFGAVLWLGIYATFKMWRMPVIEGNLNFNTVALHFAASVIWGVTTAWVFGFLQPKNRAPKSSGEG